MALVERGGIGSGARGCLPRALPSLCFEPLRASSRGAPCTSFKFYSALPQRGPVHSDARVARCVGHAIIHEGLEFQPATSEAWPGYDAWYGTFFTTHPHLCCGGNCDHIEARDSP